MMKLQADRGSGDSQSNALFPIFISLTSRGWQVRRIKRGKPDQGLACVVNVQYYEHELMELLASAPAVVCCRYSLTPK